MKYEEDNKGRPVNPTNHVKRGIRQGLSNNVIAVTRAETAESFLVPPLKMKRRSALLPRLSISSEDLNVSIWRLII